MKILHHDRLIFHRSIPPLNLHSYQLLLSLSRRLWPHFLLQNIFFGKRRTFSTVYILQPVEPHVKLPNELLYNLQK
mgnify:FL=1